MRTPQLLRTTVIAGTVAVAAACNRTDTAADARRAAAEVKKVAARAGDQLADSWLTTKIQAQYFADDDIKARFINVSTHDGVVTLSGRVESAESKQQALQIAQNTDGVREIRDHLVIGLAQARDGSSAPEQMDSAWITTKIQAKYFVDPSVNGRDINVTTTNGVVTLSGRVDSEQAKQQAVAIARGTDVVARVEDRLTVNPSVTGSTNTPAENAAPAPERVDDTALTTKIQSKFFVDNQVKAGSIDVSSKDGVVLLEGTVPSEAARKKAVSIARSTDGVVQVVDRLKVGRKR